MRSLVVPGPLGRLEAFKKRMGWSFKWVSSFRTDLNYDYHVTFTPEDQAKGDVYSVTPGGASQDDSEEDHGEAPS